MSFSLVGLLTLYTIMARLSNETRKLIVEKYCKEKISYRKVARIFKCSKSEVCKILKKFGEHHTLEDLPKTGRKKGPVNPEIDRSVIDALKSVKPLSVRAIAKKFKISVGTVQNIKKRNNIKTYKKQQMPKRTEAQQERAVKRSRKLYPLLPSVKNGCLLMDDETYVKMDTVTLPGPQYYNASPGEYVSDEMKAIKVTKFGKKVLVWQAICSCGLKSSSFFTMGTINGEIYRKECIKKRLLPLIRKHTSPPLFWPDLASCHYSGVTLDLLRSENVHFVEKEDNPPNCPQLRPIERYWAIIKRILKNDGREAQTMEDFKKMWLSASRKISNKVVQNLMNSVKSKVRNFSRKL